MPRWAFRRQVVLPVLAVAAAVALVTLTAQRFVVVSGPAAWLFDRVADLVAPAYRMGAEVRAGLDALRELARLREENARLREELARYQALERAMGEAVEGYARLKALLGLKEWYADDAVAARVVLRTPDRWLEQVVVDVGSDDGVAVGMPVVTAQGLAGRVVAVTPTHATVMLITDPDSGVGGMVLQTREAGVVLGSHVHRGRLLMRLFVADARVAPGHLVVTSGYGGAFPPGLPVGRVEQVERGGLTPLATLVPVADLDRLTEVLVIRGGQASAARGSPWLQPLTPAPPAPTGPGASGQEVR